MTAEQVDVLALIKEYAAAMSSAAMSEQHSATETYWIERAAKLYMDIATVIGRYKFVADGVREMLDGKPGANMGLLRYGLSRLDSVEYTTIERKLPDEPPVELDDTQPVDTDAIIAALEPRTRWGW